MAYKCILPCDRCTEVTIVLFNNVKNSTELRNDIKKGLIDASLLGTQKILNQFHILASVNKAVNNQNKGIMTTRSIYTEIIYCLSCTKSISGALATFGIVDSDTSILAVLVNDKDGAKARNLASKICGEIVPVEELEHFADEATIKKIYKVGNDELKNATLLNCVVGRIAAKEFVSL